MLQAIRPNQSRSATSTLFSIPASTGGLNSRDPLASMGPTDAIIMDNYFPRENTVRMRAGHSSHATGCGSGVVQTLMTYHALNGTEKLFAGANNAIYDATTAGAASSVYSTSITVNKWQWINFSSSAGLFLLAVNGTDTPLKYDGATWTTNSITGVTSSNLINIFQHKERVWLCEKNTLNLWYLPSQAISGAATKLPLGGVFNRGGNIVAGGTLSINDSGDGMDDLLCAVTSQGEVAIYSGTDPATDFLLVGVYDIGLPLGNRCTTKLGGNLVVLTTGGALTMRQMIAYDRAQEDLIAVTAKIAPTFNELARNYKANFGWQAFVYPKGPWAIFNVPVSEGVLQRQYVQNVVTGAWCRFTGMNANCWGLLNDNLYFGGNAGTVFKADTGNLDNLGQIESELKPAFNYCGSPGQSKYFTMIRPQLTASGTGAVSCGIDVDFQNTVPVSSLAATAGTVGLWGTATWGSAVWGGGTSFRKWVSAGKIGTCVAPHIKCASLGSAYEVNGFDVLYQKAKGTVL